MSKTVVVDAGRTFADWFVLYDPWGNPLPDWTLGALVVGALVLFGVCLSGFVRMGELDKDREFAERAARLGYVKGPLPATAAASAAGTVEGAGDDPEQ